MLWYLAPCVVAALAIIASWRVVQRGSGLIQPSRSSDSDDFLTTASSNNATRNATRSTLMEDGRTPHGTFVVPESYQRNNNKNNTTSNNSSSNTSKKMERTLTIEKLSSHPPIFRVKHFLTPSECTTLRRLAVEQEGLQEGYVDSDDGLSSVGTAKKKKMGIFDANRDGRLSTMELIRMVDDFFESHVSEDDIRSMLDSINLELDDEGTVSIEDFISSDTATMRRYFLKLVSDHPSKRSRHSKMAWLDARKIHNNNNKNSNDAAAAAADGLLVLESIQQRVALLTRLPAHVVHGAMELQVVHYEAPTTATNSSGGHYTSHFDSLSLSDQPCCHITNRQSPCRSCRMATVLYSLSDEGGPTAFPLAVVDDKQHGKSHGTMTAERVEEWRLSLASRESSYCAEDGPGLRIQPELGQAILWYNHDISHLQDDTTNTAAALLGELDRSTLHAGCPSASRNGAASAASTSACTTDEAKCDRWNAPGKWIANHWIEASDIPGEDAEHYATMMTQQHNQ